MSPLSCRDVRARAWSYLDGELPVEEAAALRRHLESCSACRFRLAGEGKFLARLAAAGEEPAPPELRARAATILEGGPTGERSATPRWTAIALAAAAMVADHDAHAKERPSIHPFDSASVPPPPPALIGARIEGLSRCVVEGRVYAHYTLAVAGATVSVYVPIDEAPIPLSGGAIEVDGATVRARALREGERAVVLVSNDLGPRALDSLREEG